MDPDVFFVFGAITTVFAIPAIVSAISDGRAPRAPSVIIIVGALMLVYALSEKPGAYTVETAPDVFVRVIGKLLR